MSHPLVLQAAEGVLPPWAHATDQRRAHMGRVAALLDSWGTALALPEAEAVRWRAAAYLHDAVRNAPAEVLRPLVPPEMAHLPGPLLHGPAASHKLWVDGVRDGELLRAISYHTLGHPELSRLGRALYAADFLEPGRDLLNDWRAQLRDRMPGEFHAVVQEVLGARIRYLVERGSTLRPETVAFWNVLAGEG